MAIQNGLEGEKHVGSAIDTNGGENGRFSSALPFLLIILAFLPRLFALGRYITPDELMWVYRSVLFREALLNGRFADTIITGHPGILTTWLGSLGISIQLLFQPKTYDTYIWISKMAWLMPENTLAFQRLAIFLTAGRAVVALANSVGIGLIYLLSKRLWGKLAAALIGLLLALDPFVAGLSGLLHVDALTTTFATLSLLALALLMQTGRQRWTILAGCLAALALLSKSPAILLPPLTAVFILLNNLIETTDRDVRFTLAGFKTAVSQGLLWLLSFLITASITLPALVFAPSNVLAVVSGTANRHVGNALRPTFFWGDVTFDHGLPFYPVALAYRLGAIVLIGIIIFVLFLLWKRGRSRYWSMPTLLLVAWVFLFIVGITLAAKKFDRYALPTIPALTILAVLGWQQLWQWRQQWVSWIVVGFGVLQAVYLLAVAPYPLAAFNPLLGGQRGAEGVLTVGWGEAIGAAGEWLSQLPEAEGKTAVSGFPPVLAPFYTGTSLLPGAVGQSQADYIIQTVNSRQLQGDAPSSLPADAELIHTVRFAGRDQAWIYQQPNPQPLPQPITLLDAPFSFNNQVQLLGAQAAVEGERLIVTAKWGLLPGRENGRYSLKLTLRDNNGFTWTSIETPFVSNVAFYPEHWEPGETSEVRYPIVLPPGLPPDDYLVEMTLFAAETQARLPLLTAAGVFAGVTHELENVAVGDVRLFAAHSDYDIAMQLAASAHSGGLKLVGQATLPPQRQTGQSIPIDLFWQADAPLVPDHYLLFGLGDVNRPLLTQLEPLSRYDTGRWQMGNRVHEKYAFAVPPDAPSGVFPVWVQVQSSQGVPLSDRIVLGEIEIVATERLYRLPDEIQTPLDIDFQGEIRLRGASLAETSLKPGDAVELTLYWQAQQQPSTAYTAFIHIIDENEQIVAQADRLPAQSASDTWAEGEVIIDAYALPLPADLALGHYRIALGLYTAADGRRLAVTDDAGTIFIDNRVVLPVSVEVE